MTLSPILTRAGNFAAGGLAALALLGSGIFMGSSCSRKPSAIGIIAYNENNENAGYAVEAITPNCHVFRTLNSRGELDRFYQLLRNYAHQDIDQ